MIGVFFITTAWGRNNGGINSVNYALIKSFSQIVSEEWKVYCVLTQEKVDSDLIDEVENKWRITLINTKTPPTSTNIKNIISKNQFEQLFFIGHDIITGEYANALKGRYGNSMSILFHHMRYSRYYYLREDDPAKIKEKEDLQKSIIPYADIVVSIGPLLKESAQDLCIDARRDGVTEIHELIPGLEDIKPIEKIHMNHIVILFGRLEDKNNCIKQIELAVDALATYIQKYEEKASRIEIKCYGYADDSPVNQRKLQSEVNSIAKQAISITANSYIKDEKELYDILATASLCIMPSVYEGFGLTGYEAIAAGVPVIISKNTGLYKFLESWNGTSIKELYTGINVQGNSSGNGKAYTEADLNELVKCIDDVFREYEMHKKNALLLRKNLLEGHCTWDYAARTLNSIIEKQIKPNCVTLKPIQGRLSEKERVGFNEYIKDFLISEFCDTFCDKKEFVLKIIKYSNERSRRFTIYSSDENFHQEEKLRVRLINDGTVGILNNIYSMKKVEFPIVVSNFVCGKCFLLAEKSHFEQIETGNVGVPDHHVLAIIVAPLLYNHDLVGAISLDIYDERLAGQLSDEYADFMKNIIYNNVRHLTSLLAYHFYHEIRDELKFSEVKKMISNRELVSFSGKCPLNCKHCFTKEIVEDSEVENEIADIIEQLSGKDFDVVYVSHYKENFYSPEKGIGLCEEIYKVYQCDICVTTRCIFSGGLLARIKKLNNEMRMNGHNLTFCISVPAYESYTMLEDETLVPTPQQRIDFAGQLKNMGVTSMVTVRPLFPANYIPTDEIHKIIDSCKGKVDAILTGGACVSERILKDLGVHKEVFTYDEKEKSEYLVGVEKEFYAVNVESELKDLESYCNLKQIPFFRHSMDALNFFVVS